VLAADAATLATAIFAAVAALAAWAAVATDLLRQRKARQPNVSAGFIEVTPRAAFEQREQQVACQIEFVNMGPGLAIQLAYLIVGNALRQGEIVGTGHLQAGERAVVGVSIDVPGKTADIVWACRDIDQRQHVWSYHGQHKRLRHGSYLNLGDCFRLMYPNVNLPTRTPGASEDTSAPAQRQFGTELGTDPSGSSRISGGGSRAETPLP
jgi:hypothetical protein